MIRYSFEGYNCEKHARATGRDLAISIKDAIEISSLLRKKKLSKAKATLQRVLDMKEAIPFKRFTNGIGHRRGDLGTGRYPIKASNNFLDLLNSVEANATNKGLNIDNLKIIHINAHKASSPMHAGRHSGREMKRTHVEVIVGESK